MANLELITGHGESDHISSFDMRASNRATFGKGKYILTDAENMNITIVVTDKILSISPGSCMWSGMHIRNEGVISVPFVSPASTDFVYFWLHYTRDASSLVESVEIVSTTSNTVSADLIYDELPDDVTDAYTLFCSFTFNPNGNVPTNIKSEFALIQGMNDFFAESTQKLNAQAADNAQKLNELTNDINNTISEFEKSMLGVIYDVTKIASIYISDAQSSQNLTLTEPASNFKALLITVGNYQAMMNHNAYSKQQFLDVSIPNSENGNVLIKKSVFSLNSAKTQVNIGFSGVLLRRGSLGSFETDPSLYWGESITIYGIGRVTE